MSIRIIMAAAGAAIVIGGLAAPAAAAPDNRFATSSHARIETMIRKQDQFHVRMRANEIARKTYALGVPGRVAVNEPVGSIRANR